jgi:hypothetical protein
MSMVGVGVTESKGALTMNQILTNIVRDIGYSATIYIIEEIAAESDIIRMTGATRILAFAGANIAEFENPPMVDIPENWWNMVADIVRNNGIVGVLQILRDIANNNGDTDIAKRINKTMTDIASL